MAEDDISQLLLDVFAGRVVRKDLTKLIKDALNGVVWKDDQQVVELHAIKRYGTKPMTEIFIEELLGAGGCREGRGS